MEVSTLVRNRLLLREEVLQLYLLLLLLLLREEELDEACGRRCRLLRLSALKLLPTDRRK